MASRKAKKQRQRIERQARAEDLARQHRQRIALAIVVAVVSAAAIVAIVQLVGS